MLSAPLLCCASAGVAASSNAAYCRPPRTLPPVLITTSVSAEPARELSITSASKVLTTVLGIQAYLQRKTPQCDLPAFSSSALPALLASATEFYQSAGKTTSIMTGAAAGRPKHACITDTAHKLLQVHYFLPFATENSRDVSLP